MIFIYTSGSIISLLFYVYFIYMIEKETYTISQYTIPKKIFDCVAMGLLSWFSLPFILVTIFKIQNITGPIWLYKYTEKVVFYFLKFIKGKEYAK